MISSSYKVTSTLHEGVGAGKDFPNLSSSIQNLKDSAKDSK